MSNRRAARPQPRRSGRHAGTRSAALLSDAGSAHRRLLAWPWLAAAATAALSVISAAILIAKAHSAPLAGTLYASHGADHINPGDPHPEYNSDPPTSGWHYPSPPQRGIYTTPLPEELRVHFMEHAGVVVHYNPDVLPPQQREQLTATVKSELNKGQGLVLLAPDPLAPQAVALTAWQRLQTFPGVTGNKGKNEDFIERLECYYDPEGVSDPRTVSFSIRQRHPVLTQRLSSVACCHPTRQRLPQGRHTGLRSQRLREPRGATGKSARRRSEEARTWSRIPSDLRLRRRGPSWQPGAGSPDGVTASGGRSGRRSLATRRPPLGEPYLRRGA